MEQIVYGLLSLMDNERKEILPKTQRGRSCCLAGVWMGENHMWRYTPRVYHHKGSCNQCYSKRVGLGLDGHL